MSYNKETGMYEGYIYKIYNDVNDKIYIGQTKRALSVRFNQHLSKTRHKEDNSILHKAIDKYGDDVFHIEKIHFIQQKTEKLLLDELNKYEMIYIEKYNSLAPNGYNILKGGNHSPIEHRIHPLYKFSMEGVFIEKFDSTTEALISVGQINDKGAKMNYHLKTDACLYGYLWTDDPNKNPLIQYNEFKSKKRKSKRKGKCIISKYDNNMNFEKHYFSKQEVFNDNKDMSNSSLYRALISNGSKLYLNSYWYYANDPNQPDKTKIIA